MSVAGDRQTMAILNDTTRCTGCEKCVSACKQTYGLGPDRAWRWKEDIDVLSSTRFTTILRQPGNRFVRQQCRHCLEPACASACIVGALRKSDLGPVTFDEKRCMGCRYCMLSCPYGIPRYSWEDQVPLVRKCSMCYGRLQEGRQPACTEACPYGATVFGTRAEVLAEARSRMAAEPDRYYPQGSPRIFGEHEVGGASVLYISDIDLTPILAWRPDLGTQPLPALTWAALSKIPPMILGVAGLMSGVYWIIGRRMKLAALAAEEREAALKAREQEEGSGAG